MRFRAEQHLRRQNEIRAVRELGRRIECRAFTVWWRQRQPAADQPVFNLPRVCVIASTKAVGVAVRRNRAKRRLREVFRSQQHHLPATCDVLLIAREPATTWPIAELEQKLAEAGRQMAPRAATESS